MTEFREYVIQPGTLISLGVFLFGLGATYIKIISRIEKNEERINEMEETIKELNIDDIRASLIRMETNLDRVVVAIKELQSNSKGKK